MEQLIIGLSGVVALLLTQCETPELQRYACIVGIIGQPFWLYYTFIDADWGFFAVSVAATFAWLRGLHRFWLQKPARC